MTDTKNIRKVLEKLQVEIPIQYQSFKDWFESLPANRQKHFQNEIITKCKTHYSTFRTWVNEAHSPRQEDRNIINEIAGRILTYHNAKIKTATIQ